MVLLLHFHPAQAEETQTTTLPRFVMGFYLPAIYDEVNIKDVKVTMDYWFKEISRDMRILESEADYFDDIQEISRKFHNNELDIIIVPPLSLIKHFDLGDLGQGIAGSRTGGLMNSLVLLVNDNPAITDLGNLKGKKLLLLENDELSEMYIDTLVRKQFHVGYEKFFGEVIRKNKSDRLVLDLFFGKADAILVYLRSFDTMAELNPQIKSKIRTLLSFELRSKNYSFFSKNFPYTQRIMENIKSFAKNPRGRELLELYKTDELTEASVSELAPLEQLYKEHTELLKKFK